MKVLVNLKLEKVHNDIKLSKLMLKKNPNNEILKKRLELAYEQQKVIHEKFPQFLI